MSYFFIFIRNKWDYIIIGSGMGGMIAAALLAKLGKRVLFCEFGARPASADYLEVSSISHAPSQPLSMDFEGEGHGLFGGGATFGRARLVILVPLTENISTGLSFGRPTIREP